MFYWYLSVENLWLPSNVEHTRPKCCFTDTSSRPLSVSMVGIQSNIAYDIHQILRAHTETLEQIEQFSNSLLHTVESGFNVNAKFICFIVHPLRDIFRIRAPTLNRVFIWINIK